MPMPTASTKAVIKKALGRALGIGLLLVVSYRVIGRMPHATTWVCLGVAVTAFSVYSAWRDVAANKPRRL